MNPTTTHTKKKKQITYYKQTQLTNQTPKSKLTNIKTKELRNTIKHSKLNRCSNTTQHQRNQQNQASTIKPNHTEVHLTYNTQTAT